MTLNGQILPPATEFHLSEFSVSSVILGWEEKGSRKTANDFSVFTAVLLFVPHPQGEPL
jgi:hypothetical protein